jgi:hypothetical protein
VNFTVVLPALLLVLGSTSQATNDDDFNVYEGHDAAAVVADDILPQTPKLLEDPLQVNDQAPGTLPDLQARYMDTQTKYGMCFPHSE